MANSRAIEAARASVRIDGDDSPLRRAMAGVKSLMASTAAGITRVFTAAGSFAFGDLFARGLIKATAAVFDFAASGAAIDDASKRTGASAEALSQLQFAAEQSGAALGDVESGMKKLADVTTQAKAGSNSAAQALAAIGLSASDLDGLSVDQQFEAVAEALSQIKDPSVRASRAMDVWGKSALNLLPLSEDGAAGIAKLRAEADRLGVTMSGDQAEAAAAFDDAWTALKATAGAAAKVFAVAVLPTITSLVGKVSTAIPYMVEFAQWIGNGIVEAASRGFAALSQYLTGFDSLLAGAKTALGGIADAMKSGDMALAAKIGWLTIKTAFLEGINAISNEWTLWKKAFLDVFGAAIASATSIWHSFQNTLSKGITDIMAFFDSSIDAEAVKGELDIMLTEQLDKVRNDAQAEQAARDAAFESDVLSVNKDLEAARKEWADAVARAKTQAEEAANAPTAADTASDKFSQLLTDLKTGDIASRIDSTASANNSTDLRTSAGASSLTSLINQTGKLGQQQLTMLQQIRAIESKQLEIARDGLKAVVV